MLTRTSLCCAALAASAVCTPAAADGPSFDRPGISFSTSTLSPGTFDIEQGLPDYVHEAEGGVRATLLSAGTLLRLGLVENAELQLSTSLYNRLQVKGGGQGHTAHGMGDTGVALKLALPVLPQPWTLAVLGGATFATGADAFTADETTYSLGGTAGYDLDDTKALAFYANVDFADGDTVVTVSPSLSFVISDVLGAFVEAGATDAPGGVEDYVAGGGVTYLLMSRVQLDAYVDAGLTDESTDLQAGFGVSMYFE